MTKYETLVEEHRASCIAAVRRHAERREEINFAYGAPKGWRVPGTPSTEERIAAINAECDRYLHVTSAEPEPEILLPYSRREKAKIVLFVIALEVAIGFLCWWLKIEL